jgi:hypothetical protein
MDVSRGHDGRITEVLRLWRDGVPKERIAARLGLDPKTVRRYVAVAEGEGIAATPGALSDEQLRTVLVALHPGGGRPRGDGWSHCQAHQTRIAPWLADGIRLTKIRKLLVPCHHRPGEEAGAHEEVARPPVAGSTPTACTPRLASVHYRIDASSPPSARRRTVTWTWSPGRFSTCSCRLATMAIVALLSASLRAMTSRGCARAPSSARRNASRKRSGIRSMSRPSGGTTTMRLCSVIPSRDTTTGSPIGARLPASSIWLTQLAGGTSWTQPCDITHATVRITNRCLVIWVVRRQGKRTPRGFLQQ